MGIGLKESQNMNFFLLLLKWKKKKEAFPLTELFTHLNSSFCYKVSKNGYYKK